MRRALVPLACVLMACGSPAEPNTLTRQEVEDGWELLFDGRTTSGWRGYGMAEFPATGWRAQAGELVVLPAGAEGGGIGGDIVTEAVFADFELVFDFLVTPVGNSGVFYRVVEHEGEALWQVAPEFQVLDDSVHVERGSTPVHLTGANYDLQASAVDASAPIGEWNSARIVVVGSHVEHWLNGQMTVEYELWSPEWEAQVAESKFAPHAHYGRASEGHIGIQDYDREIRYRNIKIRRR